MNVSPFRVIAILLVAMACCAGLPSASAAWTDDRNPARPVLPDAAAVHITEMERRIEELTKAPGDEEVAEALLLAHKVLAIRLEHQGPESEVGSTWTDASGRPVEWYEVGDARRAVDDLQRLVARPAPARADLASLIGSDQQFEELGQAGRYPQAQAIIERQIEVRRRILGDAHPLTLTSIDNMGLVLHSQGKLAEAELNWREALDGFHRVLGDEHPKTLTSINNMGLLLYTQGKLAEAEPYFRQALEGCRRVLGDDDQQTLLAMNNMAGLLQARGARDEADLLHREALERRRRVLGDDHPDTLMSINNMSDLLVVQGKLAEAEPYKREALDGCRRVLGDDNPDTLVAMHNMAALLRDQGKLAEAESYNREALDGFRRVLGPDHQYTLSSMLNLGTLLSYQGKLAEAEPFLRAALEGFRRVGGDEHPATLTAIHNMGLLLYSQGKLAEAEPYWREALEVRRRVLGDNHPDTLRTIGSMGSLLQAQGELDEAEPYMRASLDGSRRVLGNDHPDTLNVIINMGGLLRAQGKLADAELYWRESMEGSRRVLGAKHAQTLASINNISGVLRDQGKLAEAEPYCREAMEGRRLVLGEQHADTLASIANMGCLLEREGKDAEAEPYYREALDLAERLRASVIGEERERSEYSAKLKMSAIAAQYAAVLVDLNRAPEAFGVAERGRGRALLDLLERQSIDLVEQARQRAGGNAERLAGLDAALEADSVARAGVAEAEARVAALRKEREIHAKREGQAEEQRSGILASFDEQIDAQLQAVALARRQAFEAGRGVLGELRGLVPDARPLGTGPIMEHLDQRELILSYAWTPERVLLLIAGDGSCEGLVIAAGTSAVGDLHNAIAGLRRALSEPPADAEAKVETAPILATVVPAKCRDRVAGARRLVVLPDGPLNDIPFDLLLQRDSALAGPSVVYAGSATMYINRRLASRRLERSGRPTALVLGDPVFDREAPEQPQFPESGVLISMVTEGSNAAQAGLRRGDVLLEYAGTEISGYEGMLQAVARVKGQADAGQHPADERLPVTYWREGQRAQTTLAPGRLGVQLGRGDPALGLQAMARAARGFDGGNAEATALDQVRLHGGQLAALPGTGLEARAISAIVEAGGGDAALLMGVDATVGNLTSQVEGRRFVHLATHGLTGNAARPYEASLALAQPQQASPQDIGFLRLEDLIREWRDRLSSCDLVVLSACDTQRGVRKGDSVMALPWGFFYAGASTVIASLWKVDDTATALLMGRLYENLLGTFDESRVVGGRHYLAHTPMSKDDSLAEAKSWLRTLDSAQARAMTDDLVSGERGVFKPRTAGPVPGEERHPYVHPYYWAAFVLIGSPD